MKYILKREMLVCYEKVLIEEEKSQATIEKYMRDVRKFFQYVEEMGKKEGITKEMYSKMGYTERLKLKTENPDLYKQLSGK